MSLVGYSAHILPVISQQLAIKASFNIYGIPVKIIIRAGDNGDTIITRYLSKSGVILRCPSTVIYAYGTEFGANGNHIVDTAPRSVAIHGLKYTHLAALVTQGFVVIFYFQREDIEKLRQIAIADKQLAEMEQSLMKCSL